MPRSGEWKITKQIRADRERLRTLTREQKKQFIWDYYKLPIIVAASAVFLVLLTLVTNIGRGDTVLYAVLINADDSGDGEVFARLLTQSGVDMTGRRVDVNAGYSLNMEGSEASDANTVQVLAALFGIGDLDLFAADERVFASYAAQGAFVDIALFVDADVLSAHADDLYTYEDSYGNRILGGIWLREGSPLHEAGYYTGDVLLGAAARAEHLDEALAIIKMVLSTK